MLSTTINDIARATGTTITPLDMLSDQLCDLIEASLPESVESTTNGLCPEHPIDLGTVEEGAPGALRFRQDGREYSVAYEATFVPQMDARWNGMRQRFEPGLEVDFLGTEVYDGEGALLGTVDLPHNVGSQLVEWMEEHEGFESFATD